MKYQIQCKDGILLVTIRANDVGYLDYAAGFMKWYLFGCTHSTRENVCKEIKRTFRRDIEAGNLVILFA